MTANLKASSTELTDEERQKIINGVTISAHFMNAAIIEPFAKSVLDGVPLFDIVEGLKENIAEVQGGEIASIEAMLVGQAQALQTMFVSLGRKALKQSGLQQYTAIMNLALKAQSQSRATIQALTELKYPRQVAFVKQANISHGHQQVNNSISSAEAPREKEIQNTQNELLEVNNGSKTMDIRTTSTTSATNPAMETVATQHGRKNKRR